MPYNRFPRGNEVRKKRMNHLAQDIGIFFECLFLIANKLSVRSNHYLRINRAL